MRRAALVPRAVATLAAALAALPLVAGWRSLGPDGADVAGHAFSASEPGVVWAATASGLYRSADGGATWSAAGLAGLVTGPIAVHPLDGRHVWAVASGPTVWHSGDGGATFVPVDLGSVTTDVRDLTLDLADVDTAYLMGSINMLVTRDGGASWTEVAAPLRRGWHGTVLATPVGVFAGDRSGLYRSTDRGVTWTMTGQAPGFEVGSFASDASGQRLWVVTNSTPNPLLYTSPDGGHLWLRAAGSLPGSISPTGPIAVGPDGHVVLVRAGGRWFASSDDGATWAEVGTPPPACAGVSRVVFDPAGQGRMLAVVGGGVAASADDGTTWECTGRGLRNVTVTALFPAVGGSLWAATRDQGIYRSTDGGATWTYAGGDLPHGSVQGPGFSYFSFTVGAFAEIDGGVLAGTVGGAFVSRDVGVSWAQVAGVSGDVGAFLHDPGDPGTLVATALSTDAASGGVFVSHDGGTTWVTNPDAISAAGIAADPVRGALVASVRLRGEGGLPGFSGIVRSADHGDTWTQASVMSELAMLVADPRVPGRVWAANGRIQVSDDGGTTWQETASPTPCGPGSSLCGPHSLLVDVANDRLVAAAFDWVYESLDDASTWHPLLPAVPVQTPQSLAWPQEHLTSVPVIALDGSGRLLAGTFGRGLFVLDTSVHVPRRRLSR